MLNAICAYFLKNAMLKSNLDLNEIASGMFFVFDRHHLVVEGAAAVGISALLHDKVSVLD